MRGEVRFVMLTRPDGLTRSPHPVSESEEVMPLDVIY